MIHIIYIYFIVNSFLIGYIFEEIFSGYTSWKQIIIIIGGILLCLPILAIAFLFEYFVILFQNSFIGNIIYVYKVKKGKEIVAEEAIEIINKSSNKKKLKSKKTISDRVYIWGVNEINKIYINNSNK